MILVIDNYDSFVHNLARYLRCLGCETEVVRNDEIDIEGIHKLNPAAIVISPGPCTPAAAGCSLEVIETFFDAIPILGICLGHQAIVQALGGQVVTTQPIHGRLSRVTHTDSAMFTGIPRTFSAGRYHSLIAESKSLPEQLSVTARTSDGTIMAVEHVAFPVVGLQFHPESILTEYGSELLRNFLSLARIPC